MPYPADPRFDPYRVVIAPGEIEESRFLAPEPTEGEAVWMRGLPTPDGSPVINRMKCTRVVDHGDRKVYHLTHEPIGSGHRVFACRRR